MQKKQIYVYGISKLDEYRNAVENWQKDVDFISEYNTENNRAVGIKSISKINYRKK